MIKKGFRYYWAHITVKYVPYPKRHCRRPKLQRNFDFSRTVNDKHVRSPQVGLSAKKSFTDFMGFKLSPMDR